MLVGKHRVCQQSHTDSPCFRDAFRIYLFYPGVTPKVYLSYTVMLGLDPLVISDVILPPTCLQTVGGCWEAAVQMEAFSGRCPVQCSCSQTIHQSHISTSPQKPLPSTGVLIWGNAQPNPRAPTWGSCLNLSTLLPSVIYFASTAVHVDVERVAHCAWSFFFFHKQILSHFFRTLLCNDVFQDHFLLICLALEHGFSMLFFCWPVFFSKPEE